MLVGQTVHAVDKEDDDANEDQSEKKNKEQLRQLVIHKDKRFVVPEMNEIAQAGVVLRDVDNVLRNGWCIRKKHDGSVSKFS
jgi:hypothetical protein